MRLDGAFRTAFVLGLLGTGSAFVAPQKITTRISQRLSSSSDGFNDDFIDALRAQNRNGDAPKGDDGHGDGDGDDDDDDDDDDDSQGGRRFREMIQRAKEKQPAGAAGGLQDASRGGPMVNPFALDPIAPPNAIEGGGDSSSVSVEEQARMFREFMAQQEGSAPAAPAKTMRGGVDAKGRRIGRNRDTDTIANTSDLYFAQLKRDSSIRTKAFLEDDMKTADAVFADDGVKTLKNMFKENPYLKAQRDEEAKLIETAAEEMLNIQTKAEGQDKSYAGVSYKERLAAMKAKKSGQPLPQAPPKPQQRQQQPVVTQAPPQPKPVEVPDSEPVAMKQPLPVVPEPEPIVVQEPPEPEPFVMQHQVQSAQPPPPAQPMTEDQARNQIRNLQGMLLKHRGGPGFGSGRLRGAEVDKFEQLLSDVFNQVKSEPTAISTEPVVGTPPSHVQPVAASVPQPQTATLTPINRGVDQSRVSSAIAFVDGAIQMYKNSPPELQGGMLITLRAAIVSAVNSLGGATAGVGDGPVDPTRAVGAVACVDGAIQMYKNSPPELQGGMLVTLQAALMSAVGSLGGDATTNTPHAPPVAATTVAVEPPNVQSVPYQQQQQQQAAVTAPPPPQQQQQGPPQEEVHHGYDKNSMKLKEIYSALSDAAGDGKYGLGRLSPQEASELSSQVEELRGILMEELDSGIPEGPDYEPVSPAVPEMTSYEETAERAKQEAEMRSTMSKYQQMLAQAKAKKEQQKRGLIH